MEIGAGILATRVKKRVKKRLEQLVRQVVMVGYVASGAPARVEIPQLGEAIAEAERQTAGPVPRPVTRIQHQQFHQRVDAAIACRNPAIHIGLAKGKVRLDDKAQKRCPVMDCYAGMRTRGCGFAAGVLNRWQVSGRGFRK